MSGTFKYRPIPQMDPVCSVPHPDHRPTLFNSTVTLNTLSTLSIPNKYPLELILFLREDVEPVSRESISLHCEKWKCI